VNKRIIPLSKRPGDIAILVFFFVNILLITYIVDIEQLIIADPLHFTYPIWPPPAAVVTIWIDALFFGPFYIVAIYAYMRGKEWIRIPSIIYGSALLTVVLVILGEEIWGSHATPQLSVVLLANLPWLLFPIYIIYRMWRYPEPFTQAGVVTEAQVARPIVG
jgi:EXPERA (EXPanded EBP superfamily)